MRQNRYDKSAEELQLLEAIETGQPFRTDPDPLKADWSRKVQNPIPDSERGANLGPDDRHTVTADVSLLARLAKLGSGSPGFLAAGPREVLHFDPGAVRVALVTAGGVCPGVNTVIDEVVRRHWLYGERRLGGRFTGSSILGFTNGFRGLVNGTFLALSPQMTESWPRRGGSMLRQLREETPPDARRIVSTLQRFAIDIVYAIGGDGTLKTARQILQIAEEDQLNLAVIHIPKTMDNDIPWISQSFGFETAISEAARVVNALRDEAESNNRIGIIEVLGAGVGHTAAHTALASGEVDAVLIPEEGPLDAERILDHLDRRAFRGPRPKGYAIVLAAERAGIELDSPHGNLKVLLERHFPGKVDQFALCAKQTGIELDSTPQTLKELLERRFPMSGIKNRVFLNRPMHYIRAVPANCHDQLACRQLANCAVDSALAGYTGFSISTWLDSHVMIPFARNAGKKKHLPLEGMIWKQVMNLTGQPEFSAL